MTTPAIVFVGSPSGDRLVRNGRTRDAIGGAAFISALAARASGAAVGLVARVPSVLPDGVTRCFGPGGLSRAGLVPASGALPAFHIHYDADDRATYTHVDNGLEDTLTATDVPEAWLEAPWIHLGAIGADARRQLSFLDGLRSRGFAGRVSAGTYRRMITRDPEAARTLVDRTDLFFCNTEEFDLLCPSGAPGGTILCVTRGPAGIVVHGGPHAGEHPVPPVHVVDATGAGDAFCGGYLAGLVTDTDPVSAGAAAAGRVLGGVGAQVLIDDVAAMVGTRARPAPARIRKVAAQLATIARAATLDFTYAPHLPAGHPHALAMLCVSTMHQFGFWTADDTRGWLSPMYAMLDGVRYKGSDFVWAAFARAARTDPSQLEPARMAAEPDLLARICTADDGHCPLPVTEQFAALQVAHGRAMCARWPGGYAALLDACNASSTPVATLLAHLSELPGYAEDPLAKKANLLAIVLGNRPEHFLSLRDSENIGPIVDYHLMRGCLRTGCVDLVDPDLDRRSKHRQWVDAPEERAIRDATAAAIRQLVTLSGTSVAAVDGFFFMLGRKLCLETNKPRCDTCSLAPACAQRVENFQPVFRTTAY